MKGPLKPFHFMSEELDVEVVTISTSSEFVYEFNGNKVQFGRIRDKNVNFVLCHFQRFVIYLQRECF